ncbi:MAG TPA: thioredoxin domain-containing protein [Xanthobacteraceae bacterium]|nr:thioredoxin domain-containing protein [Xanthobacteraceae bacterium]
MSTPPQAPALHQNRLAEETSPYLLQHKDNPVEWWAWGPDALAEAKRSNRPILLSVGYAACHWCHVMAHESFEDAATAGVMNKLFVNIKVDREERPEVDQIYMAALHHLGEHGGWPLTMFLTPDGEPIWGGTYFPKTSRYGKPAFVDVLHEIARLFREEPQKIEQNRAALMERLAATARAGGGATIGIVELDNAARQLGGIIDPVNGGTRGAPKFPQAALFEFLWRAGLRTGEARYFAAVEITLDHICEGGIYDHLGGGFSRYSVDERWLAPHFEKMLYDNAQLLELLAIAHQRSGKPLYRQRAQETVAWLKREMTTREGAFSASLDADSEGEEGKFYVWSHDEVMAGLGPQDGDFFAQNYDVTAAGNFEGHNILNRLRPQPRSAADEVRLAALREKLLAARGTRVRPGLDDKVLADWNGLMIATLVNAGLIFDEPSWLDIATRAFDFVARAMTMGDRLGHSWREDKLTFPGLASDFAAMIRAALALYEATGEQNYIEQALAWQHALDRDYLNAETGTYYLTAGDAEGLVIRPAATTDEATPNHTAVAAQNLIRLATLAGDHAWRDKADKLIAAIAPLAAENLYMHMALLNAIDLRLRAAEIVVTGEGPRAQKLLAAARRRAPLDRIVLHATSAANLAPTHPARAKIEAATQPQAFVCVGETCSLPVIDPSAFNGAIEAVRHS